MFFPTYVVLTAPNDAVIHYTTDGSDPDEFSTVYTSPFVVEQAGTIIKARATVGDCAAGPITTILYQNPPFPVGLVYKCDTPDHGGTWNDWAPNTTVDNHWQIEFTLAAQTEVKRLEMHQLDASGNPIGIQWATDSSPDPTIADLHNPSVWLKADAIPGLADGAAVASWPDSAGNGNNAVQVTGAKQPLFKTAIVNSKPVIRLDGSNDELAGAMTSGATKTVLLVARKRSAPIGSSEMLISLGDDQVLSNSGLSALGWAHWNGAAGTAIGGDVTAWAVLTLKYESLSSVKFYLNNVLVATADPADTFASAVAFNLGASSAGSGFGNYDIAEVLIYDTALNDSEQFDVYAYLEAKYFDPAPTYATWPLLVFVAAAQQWAAYQNTLGLFGAGTHTLDLYGDQHFPVSGFFRLDLVLADDSRITSIINDECTTDPPVPCESPAAPTAVGLCDGAVEVAFVGDVGQNYKIYISEVGSPGGWTLLLNDTIAASPVTYEAIGLTPGALYYFRIELEYTDCGYQSSIAVQGIPLPDAEVSIATDKTIVDPSETFIISWNSDFIGGAVCGGCLDGQVSINQSIGCAAGNVPDQSIQSKVTPGIYTYTITGCNTCGAVVASVQVEVRNIATCTVRPPIVQIANPLIFLCGIADACFGIPGGAATPWNGQFAETSACNWALAGGGAVWGGCEFIGGISPPAIDGTIALTGGVWRLIITHGSLAGNTWEGTKTFGNSPLGIYTRTGGCATGPATITVT